MKYHLDKTFAIYANVYLGVGRRHWRVTSLIFGDIRTKSMRARRAKAHEQKTFTPAPVPNKMQTGARVVNKNKKKEKKKHYTYRINNCVNWDFVLFVVAPHSRYRV